MTQLLAPSESRAHIEILAELEWAIDEGEEPRFHVIQRPLLSFFPRCNCGRVLMFGPWRDGSRFVACRCGVSYLESRIWHAVPPVEPRL